VTAAADQPTGVICTFCVKPTADVETMVAGPGVYICNECVALCVELIETKPASMPEFGPWQERVPDEELLATLPKVVAVSAQLERQLTITVRTARARGITWTRIGDALGMTRQSAWERFSDEE